MKVGKSPAKHVRLEKCNHWQEKITVFPDVQKIFTNQPLNVLHVLMVGAARQDPRVVVTVRISQIKLPCTRNERVEIVATVMVKVKLPRPSHVKQGRRLMGGRIRPQLLNHKQTVGHRHVIFMMGIFVSTLKTQTIAASAMKNVSAQLLASRTPTKMKVGKPPASHVRLENLNRPQEKIIVKQTVDFQTPS